MTFKNVCVALVLAAGATAPAAAQCNVAKYGVPDFDQRRNYLDDNGSVHCVPTSLLNWMGYMANRGRPKALAHSSSNWASMSEYGLVDVRDHNMGEWMGTGDWGGGTSLGGGVGGLVDYLNHYNVGPVIVVGYASDEDWQVKPKNLYDNLKVGRLVSMCYGRYELDGDQWERDGGHCVTVTALQDACDPSRLWVGFKDPWTGSSDSINTQSAFATKWWDVSRQTRNYDGDVYSMWGPAGQDSGPNDTIKLIDKMFSIMPLFVLTADPGRSSGILQHNAEWLTSDEPNAPQAIPTPNGALVLHAQPDPRSTSTILVTAPGGGAPAQVWDYNPVEREFTSILLLPASPGAFAIDRRGDLLLEISGDLHKYRYAGDGSVRLLSSVKLGLALNSIAVDDATDDVYALSGPQRRLLKFPGGNMEAAPYEGALPEAMPVGIQPCIAPNPLDGKVWMCSEASPSIYQLTPSGAGPGWTITNSLNTGGESQPTSLQFGDHGEMKFLSGNQIKEFEIDPAGERYIPSGDPHFEGVPASRFLTLARSRSNYDPRLHDGPAYRNIEDPDPETPEIPDCVADFDANGFVNGDDFDQFVAAFEAGSIVSDIDFNGFVNGDDFDQFVLAFEGGC